MSSTIDLTEPPTGYRSLGAASTDASTDESADRPTEESTGDETQHGAPRAAVGRRVVAIVVVAAVALVVLDIVLGGVAHTERQGHLVDEFAVPLADPGPGDASMVLQIPALEVNQVVVEGDGSDALRGGPGRRLESRLPGTGGNTVVLGRSTRFSGPFERLGDLAEGDQIAIQMRAGTVYGYEVASVDTVGADSTEVLDPGGDARLTLVTSAGGPLDGRRVVVVAEPVGDHSEAAGSGAGDATAEDAEADDAEDAEAEAEDAAGAPGAPGFDRPGGALLLMIAGLLIATIGVVAGWSLRIRYRTVTIVAVAGPAVTLGIVLVLFNVEGILPVTY